MVCKKMFCWPGHFYCDQSEALPLEAGTAEEAKCTCLGAGRHSAVWVNTDDRIIHLRLARRSKSAPWFLVDAEMYVYGIWRGLVLHAQTGILPVWQAVRGETFFLHANAVLVGGATLVGGP